MNEIKELKLKYYELKVKYEGLTLRESDEYEELVKEKEEEG